MTTENKIEPRLLATTPSLGVRLWIERDKPGTSDMVCLHMGNEGGRGTARYLATLPVRRMPADRLEAGLDLGTLSGSPRYDKNGPWQRHLKTPPKTLPTPYARRYTGDEWRAMSCGEPWVLVLALFANAAARQPGDDEYTDDDIVGALKDFFAQQPHPPHLLRRGLVYLPATDQPPASL
ncbi:MAG: hypothetical protein H7242_12975, partial [Microbacteriaceae bacterium]|nr:hypothetical protein [Burkholderiaceae bacterium]